MIFYMHLITVITWMQPVPLLKKIIIKHTLGASIAAALSTHTNSILDSCIQSSNQCSKNEVHSNNFLGQLSSQNKQRKSQFTNNQMSHTITMKRRHAAFDFIAYYINLRCYRILSTLETLTIFLL